MVMLCTMSHRWLTAPVLKQGVSLSVNVCLECSRQPGNHIRLLIKSTSVSVSFLELACCCVAGHSSQAVETVHMITHH